VELTTHLYQAARLKKVEVCLYSPSRPSWPVTERTAHHINLYIIHWSIRKILRSWLICSKRLVSTNNIAKMCVNFIKFATKPLSNKHILQDRQNTYILDRSRKHCCRGKAIRVTYSEYVCVCMCVCVCVCVCVSVVLFIQHAERMCRITLSPVACLSVPYFPTLSHKWYNFREKVIERKMCALIFSTNLSKIFLILRRIHRDTVINRHSLSYKVSFILVTFNQA
jgi:hypothetical protein